MVRPLNIILALVVAWIIAVSVVIGIDDDTGANVIPGTDIEFPCQEDEYLGYSTSDTERVVCMSGDDVSRIETHLTSN